MADGDLAYSHLTERENLLVDGTCHDYPRDHAILVSYQGGVSMNDNNTERKC